MNERAVIGDNNPPGPIDFARETYFEISKFLADNPVIQGEDLAREAKLFLDRGKASIADLDQHKDQEAKPHHTAWQAALAKYRPATDSLTKIVGVLRGRLQAFLAAEDARKAAIAEQKRVEAQRAIEAAREAERLEAEAKDNSAYGEIGVDVGAAIQDADDAFQVAKSAVHQAAVAERDSKTRLGGGFTKAISLRSKAVLVLQDWQAAINCVGVTDDIREAILKAARAYKKLHSKLPDGIAEEIERVL